MLIYGYYVLFSTKQYVKNNGRPDIFVILSDYKNMQRVHYWSRNAAY